MLTTNTGDTVGTMASKLNGLYPVTTIPGISASIAVVFVLQRWMQIKPCDAATEERVFLTIIFIVSLSVQLVQWFFTRDKDEQEPPAKPNK